MPLSLTLLPLSLRALTQCAAAQPIDDLAYPDEPESLPPPFVAARALQTAAAGHPLPWSTVFLMLDRDAGRIVGSCGFKAAPQAGRVEVGYGVAPVARRRGVATTSVRVLLDQGFAAGAAQVLAAVAPTNAGSTRVVTQLGFQACGTRTDDDGELLVQWLLARPA